MTIEPGIAGMVVAAAAVAPDWSAYRACPVCRAEIGAACLAMYTEIFAGRPTGPRRPLTIAHAARKRRQGR